MDKTLTRIIQLGASGTMASILQVKSDCVRKGLLAILFINSLEKNMSNIVFIATSSDGYNADKDGV